LATAEAFEEKPFSKVEAIAASVRLLTFLWREGVSAWKFASETVSKLKALSPGGFAAA
jgi:hypothetical protein